MEEGLVGRKVYGECMRNHAAAIGGYASDGCGEFTADDCRPRGHFCAACGCHRNFHRKLLVTDTSSHSTEESAISDAGRRRSRTKFTAEQKAHMRSLSERLGWRMPRRSVAKEDFEVERLCTEIGVSRQVFKVWMHNHKGRDGTAVVTAPAYSSSATNAGDSRDGDGDTKRMVDAVDS